MKSKKNKKTNKRRVYIPLPDYRNVARGTEWLRKIIKASEEKRLIELVDEMVPVVKEREPAEDDNL